VLISEATGCLRCGAKLSAGTMLTNPQAASVARAGIARCEAQVIRLLRPCVLSLAARPDHSGPPN
jgi:hypothetical protein